MQLYLPMKCILRLFCYETLRTRVEFPQSFSVHVHVQPSKGIAPLGVKSFIETHRINQQYCTDGFEGSPQLGPHYAERCK